MSETSTPKATKAVAEKAVAATSTAADQASKMADAGAEAVGRTSAAMKKSAQPMADVFDQIAKAQAEFTQRMGFDPKTFGFDPAKFGLDPAKFGFDPAKFGFDTSFGPAAPRFELLFAQHQKNVGAFFKAQAAMVDGVQTVFQRQLALFQQTLAEATSLMQAMVAEKDSRIGMEKQVDASKKAFEKILSEAQELGDVVSKSQSEAFQLLNDRALEQIEEIKAAYEKAA
jgi:phasin family protein